MSTATIDAYYPPEEVQRRYARWARCNPEDSKHRVKAWCSYVDARDGLPEGSTASRAYEIEHDQRQPSLFGGTQ